MGYVSLWFTNSTDLYSTAVCGVSYNAGSYFLSGDPTSNAQLIPNSGLRQNSHCIVDTSGLSAVASAVPEPATWAMMLLGFAGLGFAGYRSKAARSA